MTNNNGSHASDAARRPWLHSGRAIALVALLLCGPVVAHAQGLQDPARAAGPPRVVRKLVLDQTRFQMRPGERVALSAPSEALDFLLAAKSRAIVTSRLAADGAAAVPSFAPLGPAFVVGRSSRRDEVLLAASLRSKPGEYTIEISAVNEAGEERVASATVVLNPPLPVPSNAARPPVVLLNGWQIGVGGCPVSNPTGSDTYGGLGQQLQASGVPVVYFFDDCVECPNCLIEDMGNALGQFLSLIHFDTGALVPQVDLVAHSLGGLIARSYLAGLQSNGSAAPPSDPRVRKLVLIATPNFGSFLGTSPLASLAGSVFGPQALEMIPGSPLLWNLATWNQRGDDLRGVDALAVIGNAGYWSGRLPSASDGVVSLTSGSIGFARDPSRTRIVPYCHTDQDILNEATILFNPTCSGTSISNVDMSPLTGQIIRSFLANTTDWMSIGSTPARDPYLSQFGGMSFADQTAAGQWVSDIARATFGASQLNSGLVPGQFFFNEFAMGTGTFQFTSQSMGASSCGPFTEPAGYYSVVRCKPGPAIASVGPLMVNTAARVVQSGGTIAINGAGFGSSCAACQVFAVPAGSAAKSAFQVSSWSDQAIAAFLPANYAGLVAIVVQTPAGSDSINVMVSSPAPASPPVISSIVNAGSFAAGMVPGGLVTMFGKNLSPVAGIESPGGVTSYKGITVSVQGRRVPLLGIANVNGQEQISFQVPFDLGAPAVARVEVNNNGSTGSLDNVQLLRAQPGIFEYTAGTSGKYAAVLRADYSLVGPGNPASQGEAVMVFLTGMGVTLPSLQTGQVGPTAPPAVTFLQPSVQIGGSAAKVLFSGYAPGFLGLYQINFAVPNGSAGAAVSLTVSAGGTVSQTSNIAVR